jgi:hypothetical protein
LPGRLWEFALGSLAYLFPRKKKLNFNFLLVILLVSVSLASYLSLNYKLAIIIAVFFSYIIIVFSHNDNNYNFSNFFRYFGKISFSFYLWHLITISFLFNITEFFVLNFIIIFLLTLCLSIFSFNFIERKFNRDFNYDHYFKKIIQYVIVFAAIFSIYSLIVNQKIIMKSFDTLNKYATNFFHFVEKINSKPNKNNRIFIKKFDNCDNNHENFSWYTSVNCLRENSSSKLVYIFGNSFGDHIVPVTSKVFSDSNLYLARFEDCYLADSHDCVVNKKDKIISQYLEISKKYSRNLVIISLAKKKYSKKKLQEIISKLEQVKTTVIILYPHPSVDDFNNQKEMNNYYIIKQNDLQILKNFKSLIILDIFENICSNCNLKEYKELFFDGSHFNLSGSFSLSEPFKKINF